MFFKKNDESLQNQETNEIDEIAQVEQDKPSEYLPPEKEKEEKSLSQGVQTDEWDQEKERTEDDENDIDLAKEKGIEVTYDFTGDEVKEALKIYQKKTLFKKNMIYTVIFALIFVVYIATLIKNPTQKMPMILSGVCVIAIAFIWYFPLSHIKKSAKAADEDKEQFKMTIYDFAINVGEENGSYILKFNKDINQVFEIENLFILCFGKEKVFILPKRCLENSEEITNIFKKALNEKYSFNA
ncbi:MAG: hypothetical protein RSA79_00455 [Oscillospiraceae bacterium]